MWGCEITFYSELTRYPRSNVLTGSVETNTTGIEGHPFIGDIRLLTLSGCDMILGAHRLKRLGDILFNFDKLTSLSE